MADVIYNAVPIGGGTISMTNVNSAVQHLSGGLHLIVVTQASPIKIIAVVGRLTNLKSASTSFSVIRQQVLNDIPITAASNAVSVKILKLTNTRVVIAAYHPNVGTQIKVYDIDPETGELTNLNSTVVSNFESTIVTTSYAGGHLNYKDNGVYLIHGDTSFKNYENVEYSEATNTLTVNRIARQSYFGTLRRNRTFMQRSSESEKVWLSVQYDSDSNDSKTNTIGYLEGNTLRWHSNSNPTLNSSFTGLSGRMKSATVINFTDTKFVYTNGQVYQHLQMPSMNESVVASRKSVAKTSFATVDPVLHAVLRLSSNSYAVLNMLSVSEYTSNGILALRVVTNYDEEYAESSIGTSGTVRGMTFPVISSSQLYLQDGTLQEIEDDVLAFVRCTATQIIFTTIWVNQ